LLQTIVDYPRKNKPYWLIVDACTGNDKTIGGMGTILCQTDEQGKQRVISYASKQLAKHEKNYTIFSGNGSHDLGHGTFQYIPQRKTFTVFSDHKPLETSGKKHNKMLSRIQEAFMQWDFEIKYEEGIEMPADYLSRNVVEAIDMSNEDLAEMQDQDKFCKSLKHLLGKLPVEKEYSKLVPQMTELSHSCFIEHGVLWKKIKRHH
jgi:hypothetical protein